MGGSPTHSSISQRRLTVRLVCKRTAGNAADALSHREEYELSCEAPDCLKCPSKSKNESPCTPPRAGRAACRGLGSGWASIPYRSMRACAARWTPGRF